MKSRTAQLIFQSFYCALGLLGLLAAFIAGGFIFMGADRLLGRILNR